MRIPKWGVCLLGVGCCGFVGCSQTGWLRPNGRADIKTVASVNDRPVSTVAGEPGTGTSRREEIDSLDPPPAAGSRISGRVFDAEGRAVPSAKVRLGVGGSAGGRVNFATTDRSGAFTLHGLRPGRSYILIAEYQGDDGMMSGRIQTRAPGSGVRIELAARDAEVEPRGSKILPARVRSSLFPDDENDGFPATARPRVRTEEDRTDEEPPAEEATSFSSRMNRPSAAKLASAAPSEPIRAGWSVRHRPSSDAADRSRDANDVADPRDRPPSPDEAGSDDGENPLPPALEPAESGTSRSAGRLRSAGLGRDDVRTSAIPRNARARRENPSSDEDRASADRDSDSYGSAPRPIPDDALPPSTDVAPASYARAGDRSAGEAVNATSRKSTNVRRGSRDASPPASRSGDGGARAPVDAAQPGDPSGEGASRPRSSRRPTWRELSIRPDNVPVDEALRRSSGEEEADDRAGVTRAGGPPSRDIVEKSEDRTAANEPLPRRSVGVGPEKASIAEKAPPRRPRPTPGSTLAARRPASSAAPRPAGAACRLDPGRRRVVELQLPGIDGSMVSLRDLDADVILLDFWGSWCLECRQSIEHHRDLQERFGGKRVQVIGIACEKGATLDARGQAAAAAARKLGINYPVLVTTRDGTCPVQRALQVQFYPSMVLLDRDGNILQFEQGATDTTLGRIDRAVAKALRDSDGRGGE
jgi:peroxiredoxin